MAETTDPITRGELVRALNATRQSLEARATGEEALTALVAEIEKPHECVKLYDDGDGTGPCRTCGEWVGAS